MVVKQQFYFYHLVLIRYLQVPVGYTSFDEAGTFDQTLDRRLFFQYSKVFS